MLLVVFAVVFALAGSDRIQHVPSHPTEPWSVALILLGVLAALTLLSLFVRVARGKPPENPLASSYTPAPSAPATSASPRSSDARSLPTASPHSGNNSGPDTSQQGPTVQRVRRWYGVLGAVLAVVFVITTVVRVVDAGNDLKVAVPKIGEAFEATCPQPEGGANALDDERTDCTPVEVDDFFTAPDSVTVQGAEYRALAADQTDLCSSLAREPSDRAFLEDTGCSTALRALYTDPDGTLLVGTSVLVFPDATAAKAVAARFRADRTSEVQSLGTPDTEATLPPRVDQLADPLSTCLQNGRYVLCAVGAETGIPDPAGGATPGPAAAIKDLLYVPVDALLARRFRSL